MKTNKYLILAASCLLSLQLSGSANRDVISIKETGDQCPEQHQLSNNLSANIRLRFGLRPTEEEIREEQENMQQIQKNAERERQQRIEEEEEEGEEDLDAIQAYFDQELAETIQKILTGPKELSSKLNTTR